MEQVVPRPHILIVHPPDQADQAHQMVFDLYGHPGWFRQIGGPLMETTRAVEFHFATQIEPGQYDGILLMTTASGIYGTITPTVS